MVEIESIKKDFSFLFSRNDILGVLLYGSAASGNETACNCRRNVRNSGMIA